MQNVRDLKNGTSAAAQVQADALESVGLLKEAQLMRSCGLEIGKTFLIMTMAHHYVGRVIGILDECVVLADCSLVYETGSWETVQQGQFGRSEYLGLWQVALGPLGSMGEWPHELPKA